MTQSAATVTAAAATITETADPVPAETVTVTASPKSAAPSATIPGDGTFQVGVDIKPGTYVSGVPDSGNCYWARLSGSDTFDDIIDNSNSKGQSLVIIKPSDKYFESSGCNEWSKR